jgi:glycosyltransferase involved in cell wall biosynthesis
MLKAADALAADGHAVRVVATRHEPWAVEADGELLSRRLWPVTFVDYRREHSSAYWKSGVRYRAAGALAGAMGPERVPYAVAVRAYARVHDELVAAASQPTDLIYGGTTGALAAVAEAAQRMNVRYAIDLEDLHHAESSSADADFVHVLATRVAQQIFEHAAFVTTSSDEMGQAYQDRYGVRTTTIHNTFPLPPTAPDFKPSTVTPLRVYWFSQTIGYGRGLEDAIDALGRLDADCELTLRGRALPAYFEQLLARASTRSPRLRLMTLPPASPDRMVDLARGYDVGLATEPSAPLNRQVCVPNKAFTYILAGLAAVMSDMPGMRRVATDIGEGAALVPPDDVDALSAVFERWLREPARLDCAKLGAWNAAVRRWRWDHALECGRLCELVRGLES